MPSAEKFQSGLNKWGPGDRPKHTDFNADNEIINDFILSSGSGPVEPEDDIIPEDAVPGNVAVFGTDANLADSGKEFTPEGIGAVKQENGKADPIAISATIVTITESRTLALTDAGKVLDVTSAGAVTLTIPADADASLPITTELEIWQSGAGAVTIAAAAGVTLESYEGLTSTSGQYAAVALKKRAANTWRLVGNLA